jgi:type II secretory pathway pseudopilin PulG
MRTKNHAVPGGFTIIELLTVIAVIILILSMIVPGINYAKKIAKAVNVKAQIKGLGEGVEAFYGDYQYYPPSDRTRRQGSSSAAYTCGSQKMTEALVGLDLHGYDPQSSFDLETTMANSRVYAQTSPEREKSLDRRKEMFVTPGQDMLAVDVNSANPSGLYTNWGDLYATATGYKVGRLLCDAMKVKEVPNPLGGTMRAGTPFLYYKANTDTKEFTKTNATGNIYNYLDNQDLLALAPLSGDVARHAWYTGDTGAARELGMAAFYEAITNPAITTSQRPYNMTSFIIISAGYDGVFGTKDDIANYKR